MSKARRFLTIVLAIFGALVLCVVAAMLLSPRNKDTDGTTAGVPAATSTPRAAARSLPTWTPAPAAQSTAALPTVVSTVAPAVLPGVGERVEAGGIALTVTEVDTSSTGNTIFSPDAGNVYLITNVLLETVTRDEAPYNRMYFSVKDSDSYEYEAAMWSPDPGLSSGTLVKGDRVRGWLAFEVPEAAQGFVLSYEPMVILGGYSQIRISLGK